jgi:hypothetical protein
MPSSAVSPWTTFPSLVPFYDFFNRFWLVDKHLKPKKQRKRKGKPKKGNKKGEKAPTTITGRVKHLIEWMIRQTANKKDLPLYPRLQPASRYDSVSLVVSAVEFKQRFHLGTVDKMLLDAAHDAEAIYLLLDHQNIEPFIDLEQP